MPVKLCTLMVLAAATGLHAETGRAAWLRYAAVGDGSARQYRETIPAVVVTLGDAAPLESARRELLLGIRGMLGRTLRVELPSARRIRHRARHAGQRFGRPFRSSMPPPTWSRTDIGSRPCGPAPPATPLSPRPTIAGFCTARSRCCGKSLWASRWATSMRSSRPSLRCGGSTSGTIWMAPSSAAMAAAPFSGRTATRARTSPALASTPACWRRSASMAAPSTTSTPTRASWPPTSSRRWRASPRLSAPGASRWRFRWISEVPKPSAVWIPSTRSTRAWPHGGNPKPTRLYRAIPDLAGFVLKADSEGRVGPSAYGRTHADAANVVARALQPHGGLLFYRGFVYDHHMDWRNPKNDRARAAYDNFKELDGKFDDNVVIQIKNGPIDFQVREPASPLFGALEKTSQAVELQITQEYMGQARHTVFLVPMWKETLDFDMHAGAAPTPVKALVAGKVFHRPAGGFVGVANVGLDENWAGNHLSMANLYGFGRLAWDPDLSARRLAEEWTRLTFGDDPKVVETIVGIAAQLVAHLRELHRAARATDPYRHHRRSLRSRRGSLRAQRLGTVAQRRRKGRRHGSHGGHRHWFHRPVPPRRGQRVRIARLPVRTICCCSCTTFPTLTSCTPARPLSSTFTIRTTKERTRSRDTWTPGSRSRGALTTSGMARCWRNSSIRPARPRCGATPSPCGFCAPPASPMRRAAWATTRAVSRRSRWRSRATPSQDVVPWEAASGGKAVVCAAAQCAATLRFDGAPGWYTLHVQYFDLPAGVSRFRVLVANQVVDEWAAADHLPARKIDASASVRRVIPGIALRPGDEIRIEGVPDGGDPAALDYVSEYERPFLRPCPPISQPQGGDRSEHSRGSGSGEYVMGPMLARFEKELAEYQGMKNAVGVNSGTDALWLTFLALGWTRRRVHHHHQYLLRHGGGHLDRRRHGGIRGLRPADELHRSSLIEAAITPGPRPSSRFTCTASAPT